MICYCTHAFGPIPYAGTDNELIIDGEHWQSSLPHTIEAIFGDSATHAAFLKAYGLAEAEYGPPLTVHWNDWDKPFK